MMNVDSNKNDTLKIVKKSKKLCLFCLFTDVLCLKNVLKYIIQYTNYK